VKYANKRRIFSADFINFYDSFYPANASELTVIQTLFDFPVYFKFFIGLFALVNPVGIIPQNQPHGKPFGRNHPVDIAVSW